MRILHVIPSLAAVDGGPSMAVITMARALREQGVEVDIACTARASEDRHVAAGDLDVPLRCFPRTTQAYKVSLSMARWLWKHVADYDLVHVHALFSFTSIVAAFSAWRRRVPFVLRPLGTLSVYGMERRRPWLKRASMRCIEGPLLERAAAVHFTSELERQEAELLGLRLRAKVVPLAVEAPGASGSDRLRRRFPGLGQSVVLFLSRLDAKKNLEGLLQALASLGSDHPEIRLLVAGDGEPAYVDGLFDFAARLGVSARVAWAGHLAGAEKVEAFELAKVYALPSYSENFGIAAAEALAAGLPVVLGEGVALAGMAAAAGAGTVVASDPESIAAGLRPYLLDPALRERAAGNARELAAREFSASALGSRLESLYREAIAEASHAGSAAHA